MGLSESLPVTSYIKMIDIWMLFTMTIPFLEVIMHTTNEVFKRPPVLDKRVGVVKVKPAEEEQVEVEEEREECKINNKICFSLVRMASRMMLPICSLIFTLIFWVVGIIRSYSSGDAQDHNMTDCLTKDLN